MVAKPETLNRFIFNSDYPTDKIIWLYEGQTTSPSSITTKTVDIDVAKDLGSSEAILVKGAWSRDNWASAYMVGSPYQATASPEKYINVDVTWRNWGSNQGLKLNVATRNSAGASKTIKYRLWGVQREDINYAIDYPKNSTATKSKLIFSSDNNYPRIYKEGIAKGGDVIEHNLGRIPFADYWVMYFNADGTLNTWTYNPSGQVSGGTTSNSRMQATDKRITFGGSSSDYYYYRIYA